MKSHQALVLAAAAIILLGLAFTAASAQHRRSWSGIDRDDLQDLRKLEALTGLKIRIDGLRDLERLGRSEGARVKIDLEGVRDMVKDLDKLGERIGKKVARRMRVFESRGFREALKSLRDFKIDIDID